MKKLISAILVLALVLSLCVCFASAEGTTLHVWAWDDAFNGASMREAAALYHEAHPDVEISVDMITDITMVFTSAVISGEYDLLPDIILVQDRDLSKHVNLFGIYSDLTDSGIDFSKFSPYKVKAASEGGRNYGVPYDNGVACFTFRRDLLEQAGYTIEDLTDITWDRFIEIGTDVKEKLGIPMLKIRTDAGFTLLEMMMQSAGSWYFDEENNITLEDNAVLLEAIDYYLEMYEKGIIVEIPDGEQYNASFYDGSVMGTVQAAWVLTTIKKGEDLSGNWAITNVPSLSKAEGATNYSASGGCNWCVIDTSPNKEIAIDFLKETVGGGSLASEFYPAALDASVVIGSYLPATESEAYQANVEYYSNLPIYSTLVDYSANVPEISLGWYTTECRLAIASAMAQIHAGSSVNDALTEMHNNIAFQMEQY